MAIFDYFKGVLIAQLFYAIAVTMIVHSVAPVMALDNAGIFTDNPGVSIDEIGGEINSSFSKQLGLPLVDLGSLVFFSGNIIADLILNFITAVPGMVNILVSAFFLFFPVDSTLQGDFKLFITVVGGVLYLLSTMAFLASIRSGREI